MEINTVNLRLVLGFDERESIEKIVTGMGNVTLVGPGQEAVVILSPRMGEHIVKGGNWYLLGRCKKVIFVDTIKRINDYLVCNYQLLSKSMKVKGIELVGMLGVDDPLSGEDLICLKGLLGV